MSETPLFSTQSNRFPLSHGLSGGLFVLLGLFSLGCSSNMNSFDVLRTRADPGKTIVSRAEVADQGAGSASSVVGPGGHIVSKSTIGGTYLRRHASSGVKGTTVAGGLHANPRATH